MTERNDNPNPPKGPENRSNDDATEPPRPPRSTRQRENPKEQPTAAHSEGVKDAAAPGGTELKTGTPQAETSPPSEAPRPPQSKAGKLPSVPSETRRPSGGTTETSAGAAPDGGPRRSVADHADHRTQVRPGMEDPNHQSPLISDISSPPAGRDGQTPLIRVEDTHHQGPLISDNPSPPAGPDGQTPLIRVEDPGRDLGRYAVKHAGDGYSVASKAAKGIGADLPPLDRSTLNKLGEYAVAWWDLRRARKEPDPLIDGTPGRRPETRERDEP